MGIKLVKIEIYKDVLGRLGASIYGTSINNSFDIPAHHMNTKEEIIKTARQSYRDLNIHPAYMIKVYNG